MTEAFKYMNMKVVKNKGAVQNSPIFLLPLLLFYRYPFIFNRLHGLFPFCSRIISGSLPVILCSSFGWHWRRNGEF